LLQYLPQGWSAPVLPVVAVFPITPFPLPPRSLASPAPAHTCVQRTNAPPACSRQSRVQSWSRPALETVAFRHGSLPLHPRFATATPPSSNLDNQFMANLR